MSLAISGHEADGQPSSKPRSRRTFELSSPPQSGASTPTEEAQPTPGLQIPTPMEESSTPARTRSILNLTTSTLFGIYQPTGYSVDREEPSTPWGTGAETPLESRHASLDGSRSSIPGSVLQQQLGGTKWKRRGAIPVKHTSQPRRGFTGYVLPLIGRNIILSTAGILYSLLITHLHDRREIAPVPVNLDRSSWTYFVIWGLAGAALGQVLPWIDALWAPEEDEEEDSDAPKSKYQPSKTLGLSGLEGWMNVIRSIGLFVGIAFAIRRLPWQSTLQLSLTLALANPVIWYLIDRSPPGFILSTTVALGGTAVLLGINPSLLPTPPSANVSKSYGNSRWALNSSSTATMTPDELVFGILSQEAVGVVTWIASVLFVSAVCFGNIGRRLAI